MAHDTLRATYLVETPLDPARVAEVLAGEQSSGTFVRVAGETDALRQRSRAIVHALHELEPLPAPSLPSAWLQRQHLGGPWRRARIEVDFPLANIGRNLPTLAATVAGNLFDLGETTGLRLEHLSMPRTFRDRFERPRHGIAGTRAATGVAEGPLVGTIIKPNVGLSADETGALVAELCRAGVDFIKDDECCGDPEHAPVADRIRAVMAAVRAHRDTTGKQVMVAINISDEHDAMLRHAELLQREGGTCAMVSMNWTGPASVQALRRASDLVLHGHRNGYGMWARHPALGMDFHNRGRRCEEQMQVLRALWTQEVVNFEGRWHRINHAGLNPLPVQRPIPIWLGAGGSASPIPVEPVLRRIGTMSDGWFPSFPPCDEGREAVARVRSQPA